MNNETASPDNATATQVQGLIDSDRVVVFMKGVRQSPQCGFSAQVVQILDRLLPDYSTVDVLADPEIREGVKVFSDWPTIPQLYIAGEFQGGCDIIKEMYDSGELHQALGVEKPQVEALHFDVSPPAREILAGAQQRQGGVDLHLSVDALFRCDLGFGPASGSEIRVDAGDGLVLLVDPDSAARAEGLSIDVVETPQGPSLRIDNPNAPKVPQMSVQELDGLRSESTPTRLVDVRTPVEHATARIEGAELYDGVLDAELSALPKDTLLVFTCHTGQRSRAVAERYAARGHTNVHNLEGGIDAWSREIDSSVPRY